MYLAKVVRAALGEMRGILRATSPTHRRLRDTVVALAVVTIAIDLICAMLALVFERHTHPTEIHTYGSALFWTSTQLLTVSSQIPNPFSTPGRILDVAMEAYAISVVAALAGSMGAFLIRRGHELEHAAALAADAAKAAPPT